MTDEPIIGNDEQSESLVPAVDNVIRLNEADEVFISDTGNGTVFVDMYERLVRYAADLGRWYVWNGLHWEEDSEQHLKVFALTQGVIRRLREEAVVARQNEDDTARQRRLNSVVAQESVGKRKAMLEVAASDHRVQTRGELFDLRENEVVAKNGVVNLDTGAIRRGLPEDMFSRAATVSYNENASSELLNQYLDTFLPDREDQDYVFAVLGDALRSGNAHRLFPIIHGGTTSGKSQLFAGLHNCLGSYISPIGSSIFRGNLDDKPRPDLVNAMYSRIAYASEASKSWALHADQIKRLTGGDALPYRNLYKGMVKAVPRFTPIIVTNVFPRITGADTPTKRRIIVLSFDRTLSPGEEDPAVKQAFLNDPRCMEALFARLIQGAASNLLKDISKIPAKYVLATMTATGEMNHVEEFITWMRDEDYVLELDDSAEGRCVKTSHLHIAYTYWMREHGDRTDRADMISLKEFNISLRDQGWNSKKVNGGTRWMRKNLSDECRMKIGINFDL